MTAHVGPPVPAHELPAGHDTFWRHAYRHIRHQLQEVDQSTFDSGGRVEQRVLLTAADLLDDDGSGSERLALEALCDGVHRCIISRIK